MKELSIWLFVAGAIAVVLGVLYELAFQENSDMAALPVIFAAWILYFLYALCGLLRVLWIAITVWRHG